MTKTKKLTHAEARRAAKSKNYPPNDKVRVTKTAKAKACQRCHEHHAKQFSVVKEGRKRVIVPEVANRSHYCDECAKERRAELERHDQRPPKREKATKKAATKKAPAKTKKATPKRVAKKAPVRKAAKPKAPAKAPEVATEEDPF